MFYRLQSIQEEEEAMYWAWQNGRFRIIRTFREWIKSIPLQSAIVGNASSNRLILRPIVKYQIENSQPNLRWQSATQTERTNKLSKCIYLIEDRLPAVLLLIAVNWTELNFCKNKMPKSFFICSRRSFTFATVVCAGRNLFSQAIWLWHLMEFAVFLYPCASSRCECRCNIERGRWRTQSTTISWHSIRNESGTCESR